MADRRACQAAAPGAVRRNLLRVFSVAVWPAGFHLLFFWSRSRADTSGATADLVPVILVGLPALYARLIALPFVPGVEIGLALLMAIGSQIRPWVYLATLPGLLLAFAARAALPSRVLQRVLADLRLAAPRRLLEPLDRDAQIALLAGVAR